MIRTIALLSALLACTSASAVPTQAIRESWGKPGISWEQYRADALTCGRQGYYLDISKTEEAKAFVSASKQLESMPNNSAYQVPPGDGQDPLGPGQDPMGPVIGFAAQQKHVIDSINPEAKMRTLGKTMQGTIEQCLAERGYRKFRLTTTQTKRLGKLKLGSDERRQYLYSLASDPQILAAQAETPPPGATR